VAIISVMAEISGVVGRIEAGQGSTVSEGDDIAIIESMKMEIPVAAPSDGRITEIRVDVGETIEEGQEIARMET